MKTVHKYPLPREFGVVTVKMPRFSEILHVQEQRGVLQLWALVDTEEPMQDQVLEVYGTGHEIPERGDVPEDAELRHRGTAVFGELVIHVFQREIGFGVNA